MITPFDSPPADCEWRLVPHNDHYEISEHGHLRRAVGGSNSKKGKMIRPRLNKDGYVQYALHRETKRTDTHAHRLVAVAFIPNPDYLPEVAHWDGIGVHCSIENLRWATVADNAADRKRHGRQICGEKVHTNKITAAEAREVALAGGSQREIARRFGIHQSTVWAIKHGRIWKHILPPGDAL